MEIKNTAVAGTLESSDIMVTVEPGAKGVEIDLTSSVEKQFGAEIRRVIAATLAELGVKAARVIAVDKGALDCVVAARVKTAVYRASGSAEYVWA
jgi:citrate lyase subunit gamma (acyl carrier protein)